MTQAPAPSGPTTPARRSDGQRVDKWLWCARFFRTRTLAARFVADHSLRLTRNDATQRIEKPSAVLHPGDRIAFTLGARLRIIDILALAERRGPASEAQTLYSDQSPVEAAPGSPTRAGPRPTKKERRAIDRFRDEPASYAADTFSEDKRTEN